ncbi:hypothetical protein GXY_09249 [Novacetimonas hansenii ATCC 23769]|uniref:Uncharacterized protein n=1 Tax=Novacetimonas hansenii ATCC 23769 TaxID=714995 RepID=D5QFD0_NOVHA|nr:hypothetical protein GXY_09249 [Novacetimonas hansenii ATCC 23769]
MPIIPTTEIEPWMMLCYFIFHKNYMIEKFCYINNQKIQT